MVTTTCRSIIILLCNLKRHAKSPSTVLDVFWDIVIWDWIYYYYIPAIIIDSNSMVFLAWPMFQELQWSWLSRIAPYHQFYFTPIAPIRLFIISTRDLLWITCVLFLLLSTHTEIALLGGCGCSAQSVQNGRQSKGSCEEANTTLSEIINE